MGLTIKVRPGEPTERVLSKFKNLILKEGILNTLKDKRYFAKPSLKKRLKREAAARQRTKDKHKDIRQAMRDEENFLASPSEQIKNSNRGRRD
jgi:ribosomal protein S21|tara:strand:+ start:235 stop:513 length:279 start_codon:yes stop_codon:yes gene_type:complete